MKKNKIVLGTAQFGMKYGINNQIGKISKKNAFKILDYANANGIINIDTANVYGNSEKVIGEYLKKNPNHNFLLTTKISLTDLSLKDQIKNSLKVLNVSKLDTLLFHSLKSFKIYKSELEEIHKEYFGVFYDHIGVSVYTNNEIEIVINEPLLKRVQIPFNLLDNYNLRGSLIEKLKSKNKFVDVRSIFLQGLFYKNYEFIPDQLRPLHKYLLKINQISSRTGKNISELAIGYVNSFKVIDRIIIGVDSLGQLDDNYKKFNQKVPEIILKELSSINVIEKELLDPSKWIIS